MAGRFPLLADTCVNDHLVQGLKARGWDVMRAVDLYPEATKDEVLFARAAAEGRVFVTNDRPAEAGDSVAAFPLCRRERVGVRVAQREEGPTPSGRERTRMRVSSKTTILPRMSVSSRERRFARRRLSCR